LDGFTGDNHKGFSRVAYDHDSDPIGTVRRNNRQWSGVSQEELDEISAGLRLREMLTAEDLGCNICTKDIPEFSKLPKGTRLKFPSGAVLVIENYNPPCRDMAEKIANRYMTQDGKRISPRDFILQAKKKRGVVGSVDVPGDIHANDEFIVELYQAPKL
jgi:MOSC domain-containing protein YiiM